MCFLVILGPFGLFGGIVGGKDHPQELIQALIQHLLRQAAVLYCRDDIMDTGIAGTGHFQMASVLHAQRMVIAAAPVGDHIAVEAPFIHQDLLQHVAVFIGIHAVDFVVAGHDGLGSALFDSDLKAGGVQLPECPLIHHGIIGHAAKLLAVCRKVLGAGGDPLALNPSDISRCHLAGQIRILGEILEVAAAERTSLDVQARSQDDIDIHGHRFLSQCLSDLFAQRLIPAVGHGSRCGEAGGRQAGIQPQVIPCTCLPAQAVRAV